MTQVTVRKLDHTGRQVTAYRGQVLRRSAETIVLRTTWRRPSRNLGVVVLETGSHWKEYFYVDQWYNIFEIYASDGQLQGWYCNVTRPPLVTEQEIAAEDLALDLWVDSQGDMRVLDEDEFAALSLPPHDRRAARQALETLKTMAARGKPPFTRSTDGG